MVLFLNSIVINIILCHFLLKLNKKLKNGGETITRINLEGGTKYDLIRKLETYIEISDASEFIDILKENKEIIDNDEKFQTKKDFSNVRRGEVYNLLLDKYYVNLKISTITFIAFLFDFKLTNGTITMIAGLSGNLGQGVTKLNEMDRCLLKEMKTSSQKIFETDIINFNNNECLNNHLKCAKRKGVTCSLSKAEIKEKFEEYVDKNILKKRGKFYEFSF